MIKEQEMRSGGTTRKRTPVSAIILDKKARVAQLSTYIDLSDKNVEKYLEFINTWVERFFKELEGLDKLAPVEK